MVDTPDSAAPAVATAALATANESTQSHLDSPSAAAAGPLVHISAHLAELLTNAGLGPDRSSHLPGRLDKVSPCMAPAAVAVIKDPLPEQARPNPKVLLDALPPTSYRIEACSVKLPWLQPPDALPHTDSDRSSSPTGGHKAHVGLADQLRGKSWSSRLGTGDLKGGNTSKRHASVEMSRFTAGDSPGRSKSHSGSRFPPGAPARVPNPVVVARWRRAIRLVLYATHLSRSLHTLRDMKVNTLVGPDQLRHVKALGAGAFAKVELCEYTSEDLATPILVAVKRLKPTVMSRIDMELFQQEVSLLRKLRCSHVVEFVGVGYTDPKRKMETLYLVQEYMNRGSLRSLLAQQMQVAKKLFSNEDAMRWTIQLARGLAYLHEAKPMVIHRDLKLENILMSCPDKSVSSMEAKLADFGLVALINRPSQALVTERMSYARESNERPSSGRMSLALERKVSTPEGMQQAWDDRTVHRRQSYGAKMAHAGVPAMYQLSGLTGSLLYMAPEVFKNMPYNQKVDVFSFGVVIFELFSRYMMLAAISMLGTPQELHQYAARVSMGYRPPFGQQIPGPVQVLIQRCWAQSPESRPAMDEVVHELLQMQSDGVMEQWDMEDEARSGCACVVC